MSDNVTSLDDNSPDPKEIISDLRKRLKKAERDLTIANNRLVRMEIAYSASDRLANFLKAEQNKLAKYMDLMLAESPEMLIMLDEDGDFVYCTQSFLKGLGLEDFSAVEGTNFIEVLMMFDDTLTHDAVTGILERVRSSKEPIRENRRLDKNKSGDFRDYTITTKAVRDDDDKILAYFIIMNDITELNEAIRSAENANRAKSEFLASVSHELRTPLNAVNGLAEVELRKNLSGTTKDNISKIYNSGVTLLNIINDILDISKMESGKFELSDAYYDIASLINDTMNMNRVRIGDKPIEFILHVDPAIPRVFIGDELRVKQILNNLLSNAIKYTPGGIVEVSVSAEHGDSAAGICRLKCSVRDTGIGIKEEDLEHLFKEYIRLEDATTGKIEGTGLGLQITKELVHMMDGSIDVESVYGKGSTFSFAICQKVEDTEPIGETIARKLEQFHYSDDKGQNIKEIGFHDLTGINILVVDDVQINLDVAEAMLVPYNANIYFSLSGTEAIEKVRAEKPRYDIIFMDHMMPKMDGIETVRRIREELGTDYARSVPIIALTANAVKGVEELFLGAGCQGFITKPIDTAALHDALKTWVKEP